MIDADHSVTFLLEIAVVEHLAGGFHMLSEFGVADQGIGKRQHAQRVAERVTPVAGIGQAVARVFQLFIGFKPALPERAARRAGELHRPVIVRVDALADERG